MLIRGPNRPRPGQTPRGGSRWTAARLAALVAGSVLLAACAAADPGIDASPSTGPARPVYVIGNGFHTGLVVAGPAIPAGGRVAPVDFADAPYLEFGWGDRAAYTADRLTMRLALGAAFFSRGSALFVAGHDAPPAEQFAGLDVLEVRVPDRRWPALLRFVEASYARDPGGRPIRIGPGYVDASAFYLATGRFSLFNTCNTWVARALHAGGVPVVPALTLTADQLMDQLRPVARVLATRAG